MNNAPTVSVIMPAYNAESTLMRAVLSVIRQTFTDWQLLIIDDPCTGPHGIYNLWRGFSQ